MEILSNFFGWVIRIIYDLVNNNYFLAIMLFTLLTKVILFPLSYGQVKASEKMTKLSEKQKKIQDKYKNDKDKQSEEIMKLYKENKVNPLSGCLPLLVQIPIIFAMFWIVKQPLTYIKQMPKDQIKTYTQEVLQKQDVSDKEMKEEELKVAKEKNLIDMDVVKGFNLGDIPSNVFNKDESKRANPLSLLIPILTIVFAIIQSKVMQNGSSMSDEQKEMQKTTNMMMPMFSGIIAYTMPLALGVYWLFGNILQIIQQLIINKTIKKDKEENEMFTLDKGGK